MKSRARSATARPSSPGLLALLAGAAIAALGCGPEDDPEAAAQPVGQEVGGSVAAFVQCRDWAGASEGEQLATIEDIRSQVNREDAGVTSSSLTDDEAMEVFDNGCAKPYADGFRLHVIYARAAAFKPLEQIAEGDARAG